MKIHALVLLIAACGNSGGTKAKPDAGPDARVFNDAPPNVPAMITISGTAYDSGQNTSTPLANVAISLLNRADDSKLGSATSDSMGKYSITVNTNGHVVDAYILATISGYTDAASFPAAPFAADDAKADSNLITTSNFNLLSIYTGQMSGNGIIVAELLDTSSMAVMGATVASSPASGDYRYSDANGTPSSKTSTNTDGTAFFVNVPVGSVSINASKAGSTFKPHTVTAKANTFVSTVITE